MKLSQFRFDLPLNLIAQNPTKKREDSRMMVIDRKTGNITLKTAPKIRLIILMTKMSNSK